MEKIANIHFLGEKYPIVVRENSPICVNIIIFQLIYMLFFNLNTRITLGTFINVFQNERWKKMQISIFGEKYHTPTTIVVGKNPPICVNIIMFQLSHMLFPNF